jgi:uncharacterized protein
MAAYEPRYYRDNMGGARWKSFRVVHLETDLWIAVDTGSYLSGIEGYAYERAMYYREMLDNHIRIYPEFLTSLVPLVLPPPPLPHLVREMYISTEKSGTGPMSAVAGAVAEHICIDLCNVFTIKEIIIENGGDIFMKVDSPATISVYAGDSPLSEKIGIEVTPGCSPVSVCCSSGTVGHSLSFGRADACMIVCKSGAQADAFATAFCNEVKTIDDVSTVTESALQKEDILSVVIIKDDQVGIGGRLDIKLLK